MLIFPATLVCDNSKNYSRLLRVQALRSYTNLEHFLSRIYHPLTHRHDPPFDRISMGDVEV